MLTIMTAEARRAAKQQLLADLQDGYAVQETQARASLPWHPTTMYRLRQRLQADSALVLEDGWHGHLVQLRGVADVGSPIRRVLFSSLRLVRRQCEVADDVRAGRSGLCRETWKDREGRTGARLLFR